MKRSLNVVLASRVHLFLEPLAQALAWDGRLRVVATARTSHEVVAEAQRQRPAAVLIDGSSSEPREMVGRIHAAIPDLKVIALGLGETEAEIIPWVEAGVAGFVTRNGEIEDVVQSVLSAIDDELPCSRKVSALLMKRLATLASRSEPGLPDFYLTQRENQVVSLLDEGLTNKEIARELYISLSTVKNHVHNLLQKLEVGNRGAAVAKVRRLGLARPRFVARYPDGSTSWAPPRFRSGGGQAARR